MQISYQLPSNLLCLVERVQTAQIFLFQMLIEEGQRIISILISTRYRAYQDAFQARKNTQLLQFPLELEKANL